MLIPILIIPILWVVKRCISGLGVGFIDVGYIGALNSDQLPLIIYCCIIDEQGAAKGGLSSQIRHICRQSRLLHHHYASALPAILLICNAIQDSQAGATGPRAEGLVSG
jgi:uncharacterized protein YjlB